MTKSEERKKKKGLCVTKYCSQKGQPKKGYHCHKHYARKEKERHPVAYAFNNLRNNAKRRGKAFNLTLEQFRDWCSEHFYIENKGVYPDDMQVDRIILSDPRGYHIENIQPMTQRNNVRKFHAYESRGLTLPPDLMPDNEPLPF